MSATPSDRLRAKQPRRITVGVYLDEGLADRLDATVMALHEARSAGMPTEDLEALEAAKDAAQAALDAETIWFTFASIGNTRLARLVADNPPTAVQVCEATERGDDRPEFDPTTFCPVLMDAACIAPALALEDFEAVFASDNWNDAERGALFAAAYSVCVRARPLAIRPSSP